MAERAGFSIKATILNKAVHYMERLVIPARGLDEVWEMNRQAFYLYLLAEHGDYTTGLADSLFTEHRDLLHPYAKAYLVMVCRLLSKSHEMRQC